MKFINIAIIFSWNFLYENGSWEKNINKTGQTTENAFIIYYWYGRVY